MKKMDITNYQVDGTKNIAVCPKCKREAPPTEGGLLAVLCDDCQIPLATGRVATKVEVDVGEVLVQLLFHPNLRLTARQVRDRKPLRDKILRCPRAALLLENAEYDMIKAGLDAAQGFGVNDIELVDRVYDAVDYEVK